MTDLYERWSTEVDWYKPIDLGWFSYLTSLQDVSEELDGFIGCFPSSVFEPEALVAAQKDAVLGKNGYREMGWFEVAPKKDVGEGVKAFLDKQAEKSVAYIR